MSDRIITRGDTVPMYITVTNEDGTVRDITDSIIKFTARNDEYDSQYVFQQTAEILNAANGTARVTLQPANTQNLITPSVLVYDIEFRQNGVVKTLDSGLLTILSDITH